jgi:sirohydrochlorin cobaltochelatase
MSTTRSACRREPVTEPSARAGAIILVGHGTANEAAQSGLARHAATLIGSEGFAEVHVAMLHGPGPRPGEVLGRMARRPVFVVPVMMCDGMAAERAVAAAFGTEDSEVHFCPPVGMHPRLTALIADRAACTAEGLRVRPAETALLLIAHGSLRHPASEDAACRQAAALQGTGVFAEVAVAFLEQPPRVPIVLRRLNRPVVAVGLFAVAGHHAMSDVTAAIAAAGRHDVAYLGPIGADPDIASVIASMIADAPPLSAGAVR